MTNGLRRLNFTDRQRIAQRHVAICVRHATAIDPPMFTATIDLSSYSLPSDALVFIEAHRQVAWQRFSFGTVAAPTIPEDCSLRDFGSGEGVRFRIKVVEAGAGDVGAARLLAQADGITPTEDGPRQSLLPLDADPNLRDEVWRLEINDADGPIVKVSSALVLDRHAFARSPAFVTLVLPNVLRRILEWCIGDGIPDDDEWDTPRGRWVRFACATLGQVQPPASLDESDDPSDARSEWIDAVVERFSRVNQIDRTFIGWRDDDFRSARSNT